MKITEIISEAIPELPTIPFNQGNVDDAMTTMNKMQAFVKQMGLGGDKDTSSNSNSSTSDSPKTADTDDGKLSNDPTTNKKADPIPNGGPIPVSALHPSDKTKLNPKVIASYLKSHGYDSNQVAGLIVNMKWESALMPGRWVASDAGQGPSGGLFMFHNGKKDGTGLFTKMVYACGGIDNWQSNWQGQIDFAMSSAVGARYKQTKFKSPGDAASWWVINYEKPADTSGQAIARAKDAGQYAYA